MPAGNDAEDRLKALRLQIDDIDREIVKLFNSRSAAANKIGRIKKQAGQPVYVPSREKEVLEHVIRINEGPLPASAIRRLFERVIDETRSLERQVFQDDSSDS